MNIGKEPIETNNERLVLRDLQKKLRNTEIDRKLLAEEMNAIIEKQKVKIENLKKENLGLKENIATLNDKVFSHTTNIFLKTHNFEKNQEFYKQKIAELKDRKKQIVKNIGIIEEQILIQKSAIGGVNARIENQNSLVKQIKILENRLDKANQKFNESISQNKMLRQEIDSLRRERVIFDTLYKKLEKELHNKRKQMANIIEKANSAYEERDKANEQIENLKQKAKREAKDFENELKGLSELAEKNRRTLEMMYITNNNLANNDYEDNNEKKYNKNVKFYKEKGADKHMIERYKKLKLDYSKIEAATSITCFNQLIKNFVEIEEKNFKNFKYVNDLSNQIEALEKNLVELKNEKEDILNSGNDVNKQKLNYLKELETRTIKNHQDIEIFECKYFNTKKIIESLAVLIDTLFNTLQCNKSQINQMDRANGVDQNNIMKYLSIIETRATEVIHAYSLIMANKNIENVQINFNNKQKNDIGFSNTNDLPSFDEEIVDDDENNDKKAKPLTYEQLKQKAYESLHNKYTHKGGKANNKKNKFF